MARISDCVGKPAFSKEEEEKVKKCVICGNRIIKGGFWHGDEIIAICHDDAHWLIDLYLDTEKDAGIFDGMTEKRKIEYVNRIVDEKIKKKEEIDNMVEKRKAMEKLGFVYFAELGQMDFWELSMTKEELVRKAEGDLFVSGEQKSVTQEEIEICHNEIINVITKETGEQPVRIGYFAVPEFTYNDFKIGCVAKIDSNGSTFVFVDDKKLLELLDKNGYHCDIKRCI